MKITQIAKKETSNFSKIILGIGLVIVLLGFSIFMHRGTFKLNLPDFTSSSSSGAIPADQVHQYLEFAQKVAISICNIGFHNVQTYLADNSKYFAQDVLYDFQNNFFTMDLQRQITDQKLYCTAQNVVASQTKVHGDQVACWFSGDMEYTSQLNNSSIHVPFSFRLITQKYPEGFKVVGFYMATDQK